MMVFVVSMPASMAEVLGGGLAEFQPMDYNVNFKKPVSEDVIPDIFRFMDGAAEAEGKLEYSFELSSGPRDISLSIIGLAPDTAFYNFRDKEGRPLYIPEEGILLSDYAAKELGVGTGDQVRLHARAQDKEDRWTTVGGVVYQAMGVNGYMDKGLLAREYLAPGAITGFYMNADDPEAVSKLMKLPVIANVISLEATRETFQTYTELLNTYLFFMVALTGVLGFAIVYNATIISIGERETEFSSLRVLGFSRGEIFRLLLKENNVITVLGLVAGIPLSNVLLRYSSDMFSTEQYTMNMRAGLENYVQGALATIFFIVLAQAATYRKIRNLDFMAALRSR
jgi:putative ABC transport system permease protein